MTKKTQILPCPFCPCGGDPTLGEALDFGSTGENFGKGWTVTCNVCCTQNGLSRTAKEAIRHWNTRSTPAIADGADPEMPASQIRLHFGELTANEVLLVRAAIRFANSRRATANGVGVEWQPIESAPKDGTKIIVALFVPHFELSPPVTRGFPQSERKGWSFCWASRAEWDADKNRWNDGLETLANPNFWMRVIPPQAATEGYKNVPIEIGATYPKGSIPREDMTIDIPQAATDEG